MRRLRLVSARHASMRQRPQRGQRLCPRDYTNPVSTLPATFDRRLGSRRRFGPNTVQSVRYRGLSPSAVTASTAQLAKWVDEHGRAVLTRGVSRRSASRLRPSGRADREADTQQAKSCTAPSIPPCPRLDVAPPMLDVGRLHRVWPSRSIQPKNEERLARSAN